MNWWTLATAVLGGTALATLMGKLLDMWLLEPQRAKSERARWLREARLEAFAQLSSELLSFGIKSGAAIDFQKLRALSARSELLIDDPALLTDLRAFMSDMFNWNMDGLPGTKTPAARGVTLVKADGTAVKDFSVELQDGTILQKEDFEREFVRTIGFVKLEKRANDLVERLGKAARCT